MAYVQPNSTIYLFDNVKLDPRYENTAWFASRQMQTHYFTNRATHVLPSYSYQRKNKGSLRVQKPYSQMFNINYMAFINTDFENKLFYAFVNKVEYVSNEVTEIQFDIDVIQTYLFDWELLECFVEREHTASDDVGEHVLPEDLPVTAWAYSDRTKCPVFGIYDVTDPDPAKQLVVVVASTEDPHEMTNDPAYQSSFIRAYGGRVYNGCWIYGFVPPNPILTPTPNINDFLRLVIANNKVSGIVAIFMCPGVFVPVLRAGDNGFYLDISHMASMPYLWQIPKNVSWTYKNKDGQSIRPRNNKLYTAQFNKLIITDHDEASAEYEYEYFNGTQGYAEFKVYKSITPNPEFACIPDHYKGMNTASMYQLISHGYPQCSWTSDTFSRWFAANKYRLVFGNAVSGFTSGGKAAAEFAMGGELGPMFGTSHLVSGVSSLLGEMLTVNSLPDQLNGTIGQNVNLESESVGFFYYYARAIDECCQMADDFFDMYGYKVCQHKVPNIHVRLQYTYTKTKGCNIGGNVPADDARKIEAIFDAGVRFWANENDIGGYGGSNAPIS